jgi:hypothetical protein
MRDYSSICETCTCNVCECLKQTNCPIEKMKAEKRSKIARLMGCFIGRLLFQTPFLFFVVIWLS